MKNYIVYLDSGKIIKTGQCIDSDFHLQGENVIEGIANDSSQYILNGNIVNMPPKPKEESFFDYEKKQWVLDFSLQKQLIKNQRDKFLYSCDWTQIPNNPLTPAKQEEWAVYRQQLRDITQQSGYPFNVIWPTQPE